MVAYPHVATEGAAALVAVAAQAAENSVPGPTMGKKAAHTRVASLGCSAFHDVACSPAAAVDEDRMKTKSVQPLGHRDASVPHRSGHLPPFAFVTTWKVDQGRLADEGLVVVFDLGREMYHEVCRRAPVVG